MTSNAQEPATESEHMSKRLARWASEWIETLRVAPPFSRRRRELLAAIADADDPAQWVEVKRPECQGADFSRVAEALADGLSAHAHRDGLTGVRRAVFMDRGGHAPGEACPSAPPRNPHDYWCQWPEDERSCVNYPPASTPEEA